MRKKSNILVNVLDTRELREEIKTNLNHPEIINIIDSGPYGYIDTPLGKYLLDKSGNGSFYPIEMISVHELKYYALLSNDRLYESPIYTLPLNEGVVENLSVEKKVPLESFIVSLGETNEKLYEKWLEILSVAFKCNSDYSYDCPLIRSKASLSGYNKFITKKICECEEKQPLMEVLEDICCLARRHCHCKSCGGVL